MSDDRELLELSAKAADYQVIWCRNGTEDDERECFVFKSNNERWNPLEDDGDALRLAVRLQLEPEFGSNFVNVGQSHGNAGEWHLATEFGTDPLAATRRAIVRAAAQIGRILA